MQVPLPDFSAAGPADEGGEAPPPAVQPAPPSGEGQAPSTGPLAIIDPEEHQKLSRTMATDVIASEIRLGLLEGRAAGGDVGKPGRLLSKEGSEDEVVDLSGLEASDDHVMFRQALEGGLIRV